MKLGNEEKHSFADKCVPKHARAMQLGNEGNHDCTVARRSTATTEFNAAAGAR
jgi:hypothetical protein